MKFPITAKCPSNSCTFTLIVIIDNLVKTNTKLTLHSIHTLSIETRPQTKFTKHVTENRQNANQRNHLLNDVSKTRAFSTVRSQTGYTLPLRPPTIDWSFWRLIAASTRWTLVVYAYTLIQYTYTVIHPVVGNFLVSRECEMPGCSAAHTVK